VKGAGIGSGNGLEGIVPRGLLGEVGRQFNSRPRAEEPFPSRLRSAGSTREQLSKARLGMRALADQLKLVGVGVSASTLRYVWQRQNCLNR
jgi:hypothetical protein